LAVIVLAAFIYIGGIILLWHRKWLRSGFIAAVVLVLLILVFPGREFDTQALRRSYVSSLIGFEGTRYCWGGENRVGIDCSGLVRKGLINTWLWEGIRAANPSLLREAASLWWFDTSADALLLEYRGKTRFLFKSQTINKIEPFSLMPVDLAITQDGVHVHAYIGDNRWIETDPDMKKVLILSTPQEENFWFNVPVSVVR
jgi:hypothetical protein